MFLSHTPVYRNIQILLPYLQLSLKAFQLILDPGIEKIDVCRWVVHLDITLYQIVLRNWGIL